MNTTRYSIEDILEDFDSYDSSFVNLEHPYFFTAGSRLTLLADDQRWAMVFEVSGYGNRSGYGEIELYYFGNCLDNLKLSSQGYETYNLHFLYIIRGEELERIEEDFELVSPLIETLKVRNVYLPIEHDVRKYAKKNITVQDYDNPRNLVDFPSLIRYMDEEYPHLFRATEAEIRTLLPDELPLLMRIDQWHHKSYFDGVKPSEYETYRMIAEILVSKDVSKWKPTLEPNNDWRNWPEAGCL